MDIGIQSVPGVLRNANINSGFSERRRREGGQVYFVRFFIECTLSLGVVAVGVAHLVSIISEMTHPDGGSLFIARFIFSTSIMALIGLWIWYVWYKFELYSVRSGVDIIKEWPVWLLLFIFAMITLVPTSYLSLLG